ncbi:MAG TPA: aminopeptidase P family protein [Hyphomicrobiaceae bacterium]|nr:aminopeptidase P family protein [Hyphomicrobiaceae bacterium]
MREGKLDALIVPRADEHQGEYVPACAERLRWLSGFTGSAGLAAITGTSAALLIDGRYTVQARKEVDGTLFQILASPDERLSDWLADKLGCEAVVGFDPWLHTLAEVDDLRKRLASKRIRLRPTKRNLVDVAWGGERPAPPLAPVSPHPLKFAGTPADAKIAAVQKRLAEDGQDAVILTLPDSIAWLFNIRGRDVAHNPVPLAFAIVPVKGKPELFIDRRKIGAETRAYLAPLARLSPPDALAARVKGLAATEKRVRLDPTTAAYWFARTLGAKRFVCGEDPCRLPKSRKNATEIKGARAAHLRDGVAMARFLAWLDRMAPAGRVDEIAAASELERLRRASNMMQDLSFDTISGAGPNGAIVHYRVTTATNRPLRSGELYLVDSGAQYFDGTTDVTRTVAVGPPSAEMRTRFTAVLKAHIAIATARFPKGTRGIDLDPLARRPLWEIGVDFDHGTGHGVGSYLSVHEGPPSISKRGMTVLEPGMILSNEPGYYKEGAYGIRIENLVLVTEPAAVEGGERPMMGLETLTLVPIDRRLIVPEMLDARERGWLDAYHARVLAEIGPELAADDRAWLVAATEKIGA